MADFVKDSNSKDPSSQVVELIRDFKEKVETLEVKNNHVLTLFQDGKSGAFYFDCHIAASSAVSLLDYEASLDPEEQEEFQANRNLLPFHRAFQAMMDDAKRGRQFNDIIVEYLPKGAKSDKPLKIYGGQHRARSIEGAANIVDRYHGFRVYFDLNSSQRNEIARVSNTNINVPLDLIDRMNETVLGPSLRNWCYQAGFLQKSQDFAERKNTEGIITVRLARAFVINFMNARDIKGDIEEKPFSNLLGNEVNEEYLGFTREKREKLLKDARLLEAAKNYAALHKKQLDTTKKDPELSQIAEYRTKAMTPTVLSSWAFVAGLLQKKPSRLSKLYQLPKNCGSKNPLSVKEMTDYKHHSYDPKTYRGLGTRTDKRERGKLIELFLLYTAANQTRITTNLIDTAVTSYYANVANEERRKKMTKLRKD